MTAAGAAGCFLSEEEVASTDDEVTAGADASNVLKSTLILDEGCIATKVGPRHLLVAARCVADKPAFAAGKKLTFKVASAPSANVERDSAPIVVGETDGGVASARDGGASTGDGGVAPGRDGGASTGDGETNVPSTSNREATISEVMIHTSFTSKCAGQTCAFGTVAASDAKDVAVILLDSELERIPSIPVDLDAVGDGDSVLAIGSGCTKLDGTPRGTTTFKTTAVRARSVNHEGSPYKAAPEHVGRLKAGYVVTAGIGWRKDEVELCKNDIGAPLFRAGHAAVAGITSNFTTFEETLLTPVTVHYTRVDTPSKVGAWLASIGVETTKTCSDTTEGCVAREDSSEVPSRPTRTDGTTEPGDEDAGPVAKDGGADEDGEDEDGEDEVKGFPTRGEQEELGEGEDPYVQRTNDGEGYDAGPRKKKKKKASGCSAAPGSATMEGGFALAFGVAAFAAAARRRRR